MDTIDWKFIQSEIESRMIQACKEICAQVIQEAQQKYQRSLCTSEIQHSTPIINEQSHDEIKIDHESSNKLNANEEVHLDVGGKIFTTSLSTLTKDPDSMLSSMFSGRYPVKKTKEGRVFIDRDGSVFDIILDYLRDGEFDVPEDPRSVNKLLREAQFYGIRGIESALESMTSHMTPQSYILAVGGSSMQRNKTNSVYQFDLADRTWATLRPMKLPRARHSVTAYSRKVYAVGGVDSHKSGEVFDLTKNQWNDIAPMHEDRCDFGTVLAGHLIYAVGGVDNASMECYDPMTDTWEMLKAKLPCENSFFGITEWDHCIVISGGNSDTIEMYDPQQGKWTKLGSCDKIRGHKLVNFDHNICSIGGHHWNSPISSATNTVKLFDMRMRIWTQLPSMKVPRAAHAAVVANGAVMVMGGYHGKSAEVYEPQSNKWEMLVSMPEDRYAFGLVVV